MERDDTKTIIVDFDGTICKEIKVPDEASEIGPPEPHVKEALKKLKDLGYIIKIHSCRTATYWKNQNRSEHIQLIRKYMGRHDLPYDDIIVSLNMDKPCAKAYIDNRAIRYNGNWLEIVKELENLKEKK